MEHKKMFADTPQKKKHTVGMQLETQEFKKYKKK